MKVGDRFIFNICETAVIKKIYFINSERDTIYYADVENPMAHSYCDFSFFEQHAIILTPLTEELL